MPFPPLVLRCSSGVSKFPTEWTQFQINFMSHCEFFADLYKTDVITDVMRAYNKWDSQDGMDYCTAQLKGQHAKLFHFAKLTRKD